MLKFYFIAFTLNIIFTVMGFYTMHRLDQMIETTLEENKKHTNMVALFFFVCIIFSGMSAFVFGVMLLRQLN